MAARPIRLALWAARGALRAPLHSGLVVFASLAGVASLAVSAASTEAGRRQVAAAFEAQGVDAISVAPAQSRAVAGRVRTGALVQTLTLADYRSVRTIGDVVAGSALVTRSFRLRAGDLTKSAPVVGCERDYFAIKHWQVRQGRLFSGPASRQAVLGAQAARDLFGDEAPSGRRLTIDPGPVCRRRRAGRRPRPARLDVANEDDQVYVPLQAAMRRLMNTDSLGGMILQASGPARIAPTAAAVRARLSERHRRSSTAGRTISRSAARPGCRTPNRPPRRGSPSSCAGWAPALRGGLGVRRPGALLDRGQRTDARDRRAAGVGRSDAGTSCWSSSSSPDAPPSSAASQRYRPASC